MNAATRPNIKDLLVDAANLSVDQLPMLPVIFDRVGAHLTERLRGLGFGAAALHPERHRKRAHRRVARRLRHARHRRHPARAGVGQPRHRRLRPRLRLHHRRDAVRRRRRRAAVRRGAQPVERRGAGRAVPFRAGRPGPSAGVRLGLAGALPLSSAPRRAWISPPPAAATIPPSSRASSFRRSTAAARCSSSFRRRRCRRSASR